MPRLIPILSIASLGIYCSFADDTVYQKPSKEILDVLHAASTLLLDINPSKTHAMLIRMRRNRVQAVVAPASDS